MAYRLARTAEDQIDALLLDSAREHGLEAADRYGQLILTAMAVLGEEPYITGSVEVARFPASALTQPGLPGSASSLHAASPVLGTSSSTAWRWMA